MKKIAALFLVISLALAGTQARAQVSVPSQCSAYRPACLDKNVIKQTDLSSVISGTYGQKPEPPQKKYWFAMSDRSKNKTYNNPQNGAKEFGELSFQERVIIAQVKNGYALVIDDPKYDHWPNISSKAVVRGWIPLSRLLLWDSCPANDFGIYNKAVICANADASTIKNTALLGKLFSDPADEKHTARLKTDMKFYYVMKTEGTKSLLATEYKLKDFTLKFLYGWVDASSFVPWNQRTCLEPTWDISNAEKFADTKVTAKVFRDKTASQTKLVDIPFRKQNQASGQFDPFMYRMDPFLLRYPILDGGDKNVYHCTAFATPSGVAPLGSDAGRQIEKLNKLLEAKSNVNIAIVLDATSSMGEYFTPVKNAIIEGCKYFQDEIVKVGVVAFRDKEDGARLTEYFPMTKISSGASDENKLNPKFVEWLTKLKASSIAPGEKESLYYGINKAFEVFEFNPEESNIILVVGDCGDNGKMGVQQETLINKIAEKNVSIMGFQVRNKTSEAFQDFNIQMLTLMKNAIQTRYDNDGKALGAADQKKYSGMKVRASEVKGGYDIVNNVGNNLYIGIYRNADSGSEMPPSALTAVMENSFNEWKKSIQQIKDLILKAAGGDWADPIFDVSDGPVNENVLANKAALMNLVGAETFKALERTNSLLAFQGWAKKIDPGNREYFKSVVFISSDELNFLIEKLAPVYRVARTRSNSRTEYVEALKALVKSLLPGITADEINKYGYNEVMRLISGLNESTASLKGPSIQDIADPNVVSQAQYMSLVNAMVKKYGNLLNIQSADYKYCRLFAGIKYYWLPIEDLP